MCCRLVCLALQCLPAAPKNEQPAPKPVVPSPSPKPDINADVTGDEDAKPTPSPTPKDLENELTCGDAGREEAAAVAISQAIATTGARCACLRLS